MEGQTKRKKAPPVADGGANEGREADEPVQPQQQFKGQFVKDLKPMMYGFGDAPAPLSETASVVEDALLEYIAAMTTRAQVLAGGPGTRVSERELLHLVRKDPRKYSRARELLHLNVLLADSKRLTKDDDIAQAEAAAAAAVQGTRRGRGGDEHSGDNDKD